MIGEKEIDNPRAVEDLFCVPFSKLEQKPMDEEMTEYMTKLMFQSKLGGATMPFPEKDKPFALKLIENSLKTRFTFEITDNTILAFLTIVTGSAGKAIMYLTYTIFKLSLRTMDLSMLAVPCHPRFQCTHMSNHQESRKTPL